MLTREDVQALVKHVREFSPSVVDELLPNHLTLGEIQKVLHNLLRERVSIRNLESVLETLADYSPRSKDTDILTEYCRHRLAREITASYADEDTVLHVVTLEPGLEREILDAVRQSDSGDYVPLDPTRSDTIATNTVQAVQPLVLVGHEPIVLTSAPVRRYFKRLMERRMPRIVVLSYNEVDPAVQVQSEGQVTA